MNLFKNVVGYKRKRTSKSPKTVEVGEQVPDVHIDDIDEQTNGNKLLSFIT